MPYRTFRIPVCSADWAEHELNAFLAGHRVLAVDRRWVDQGANSFWAVMVDYLDAKADSLSDADTTRSKSKVDYKQVLSPEDFDVYAQLRVLRKELAAEEGVALYRVFTNEQLAKIAQSRARTLEDLRKVRGVGEARIDKFGARVVETMTAILDGKDEASGEPASADR